MAEIGSPQLLGRPVNTGNNMAYDNFLTRSNLHTQQIQDPLALISQISDSLNMNSQSINPMTSCPSPAVTRKRAEKLNLPIKSLWGDQTAKSSQDKKSGGTDVIHQK